VEQVLVHKIGLGMAGSTFKFLTLTAQLPYQRYKDMVVWNMYRFGKELMPELRGRTCTLAAKPDNAEEIGG
jgi:hypothetical protein